MREQQRHALRRERLDDILVDVGVRHVGRQDGDDGGVGDGVLQLGRGQAVVIGLFVARAALAHAHDDVGAGIAQVLGVGAALAAIADDGDALTLQAVGGNVVIGIDFHG